MLRALLRETVRLLNAAGIVPILLKGAIALLLGQYPQAAARMMTDLDLAVPEPQTGAAASALRGHCWNSRTCGPVRRPVPWTGPRCCGTWTVLAPAMPSAPSCWRCGASSVNRCPTASGRALPRAALRAALCSAWNHPRLGRWRERFIKPYRGLLALPRRLRRLPRCLRPSAWHPAKVSYLRRRWFQGLPVGD
ncbi:nucleotidyltransferase family protein [uncultured Thiodictyon sp.]|uniref:nucleotidyltransferase family protein n=1 Tax=uncultured Thiodictyon sp. TaxID=1846217 RepID=UPI0025E5ED19|nr:nucleotidyltransferase family protein [uncultured Thiodictyon sp.]